MTGECASQSQCYLAGEQYGKKGPVDMAVVLRYHIYPAGWRLERRSVLRGLAGIYGFACSSATRCAGIADHLTMTSPTSGTDHFVSISTNDAGKVWQRGSGPSLFGGWSISCPSATTCIAGGAGDSSAALAFILRTTDGGLVWSEVDLRDSEPYASVLGTACASLHLCFAVGGQRVGLTGQYAVMILKSSDGGVHWSVLRPPIDPF